MAGHQARSGGTRYIFASPGLASCRRRPLSSNVRPHSRQRTTVAPNPKQAAHECRVVALVSVNVVAHIPGMAAHVHLEPCALFCGCGQAADFKWLARVVLRAAPSRFTLGQRRVPWRVWPNPSLNRRAHGIQALNSSARFGSVHGHRVVSRLARTLGHTKRSVTPPHAH